MSLKSRWRRPLRILLLLLPLLFVLLGGAAYYAWKTCLATPVNPTERVVEIEVRSGAPFARVARELADSGTYPYPRFLSWYARWRGSAQKIQAGEYAIAANQSVDDLLRQLTEGQVIQYNLTVIEGWTFRQLRQAVAAQPQLIHTLSGQDDAAIMATLGYPGEHPEGRFFPDTYSFTKGTSDVQLLQRAYTALAERLAAVWLQRDEGIALREPYEALIMASIIEKETAREDEREAISGVFNRRLLRNMRLQTDPTVIYGLGPDFNGDITRRDLRTDSPYNTYTRGGLPPTPIALVSQASLDAAVRPQSGDSLFFVATGEPDGSHYFSVTLEEHNRALGRYLKKIRGRK